MGRKISKMFLATAVCLMGLGFMPAYAEEPVVDAVTEVNPSGRGVLDYEAVYGPVFDNLNTDEEYGWYTMWDINGNGTAEVVIGHGERPEDYRNDVWAVDEDGRAVYVGSFDSECELYEGLDGNGIVAVNKRRKDTSAARITIKDGVLISETIDGSSWDRENNTFGDQGWLVDADIRNRGNLEFWSFMDIVYGAEIV